MSIKTLDERHKALAEELLKGTPRSAIAEKLGVHRSTLYEWMKDPLWQEYFEKLAGDLDEARSVRLMVTVMKMAEVTEAYLDHILEELRGGDPDRINQLPGLDTVTVALKRIVELDRLDGGRPTRITREEKGEAAPAAQRKGEVKGMLDRLLSNKEGTQH